jgi:hypothetical protein
VQLPEVGARLNPELVVKAAPDLAVGSQGLGLPAKAVERGHAVPVELLLKRMFRSQAVDLGQSLGMPALSQLGLDPQLLRDPSHLLEPGGDRLHEPEICHIREGISAPQTEGQSQLSRRLVVGVPVESIATGLDGVLKDRGVNN